jgi:predicted porin
MVGSAYAAEGGVKLSLGGMYRGAYGSHFDTQDSNTGNVEDLKLDRGDVVKQDVEVHFNGEAVLDNGLSVGVRIELEGQTSGDQIDHTYAYISGGFGELRIGDDGDAYAKMCYITPAASHVFGADSPVFNFSNSGVFGYGATNGTCYGISDATKILYFSPIFGGFQFAASYAPDGGSEDTRNTVGGFATRSDDDALQNSEVYSVAAQFDRDFNGVHVIFGGGAAWVDDLESSGNPFIDVNDIDHATDYQAYARVGFGLGDGTLVIGGAWSDRQDRALVAAAPLTTVEQGDNEVFGVGVTYAVDAWGVGLGWTHGDYDLCQGSPTPHDCDDSHDTFEIDGTYALGPGVDIDGMIAYDDYDGDTDNADLTALSAGIGLNIGF